MEFGTSLWMKLVFSFFATAQASPSLRKDVDSLRDVGVLVRAPRAVCKKMANDANKLSAAGEAVHQGILEGYSEKPLSEEQLKKLSRLSEACVSSCRCQPVLAILEKVASSTAVENLKQKLETFAEGMTDADYEKCQKKLKLSCATPRVRDVARQLSSD